MYAKRIPIEPGVGSSGSGSVAPPYITQPETYTPPVHLIELDPETYNYVTPSAPNDDPN